MEAIAKRHPAPKGKAFLSPVGGSATSGIFNQTLLVDVLTAHGLSDHFGPGDVAGFLAAFKPQDKIEGMLAAQAVAMHFASMRCLGASHGKPFDVASRYRRDGANLARAMTEMLTALDEKRGKRRRQVVRVEKVTVEAGARAIVGNIRGAPAGEAQGAPDGADGGDWPAGT